MCCSPQSFLLRDLPLCKRDRAASATQPRRNRTQPQCDRIQQSRRFISGATHCPSGVTSSEKMLDIMTTLFSNFAKYGNPNDDPSASSNGKIWEPYDCKQPFRHLRINLP
ncbi:unnamed protein product [Strongylus vulgaris]|uniref:Uncharacterized protein n=1 Tax=Strongylus vulgaris TaxID=40348 RepID=A0A3P7JJL0_STRVU|nr:unnamed protein product [Strongylus vulgaris]